MAFLLRLYVLLLLKNVCLGYLEELQGKVGDCACNIIDVENFNNVKIFPRLRSLLTKDYFRFYKVNLQRECPFWPDDSQCAIRYCNVEPCREEDIPSGLKGISENHLLLHDVGAEKYKESDCAELSYLNTSISAKVQKDLALWTAHDDALENFCELYDSDEEAEYVDLLLNPEQYTGYKGPSAHRIWRSIYKENCFRPHQHSHPFGPADWLNGMCFEERVFYRLISGLHTSISVHLSAKSLLSESFKSPKGEWGPNSDEFVRRFAPDSTDGQGIAWLKNLYFVYLVELRALAKAAPYLEREEYYTGNEALDWDTQQAMTDLLGVAKSFPQHFDESAMFRDAERSYLKEEFKSHFRNITRIMDCVGCGKCKLWGKLQTHGLGTALKILFSKKFNPSIFVSSENHFQLQRSEIVALINSFGRLSYSIYELDEFRNTLT